MTERFFNNPSLGVVTSDGNLKGKVYKALGFELIDNNLLRKAVAEGEIAYDDRLGTDIFAPAYPDGKGYGFSYEVDVALEKAKWLTMYLRKQQKDKTFVDIPYAVTDSVWVVGGIALNKPISDKNDPTETLVDFYCRHAKQKLPISNQSGIAFVKFDDQIKDWIIQLRQVNLKTGCLNPDLNRSILERIIRDNHNIAGGLTMMMAIDYQIIIPNNPMSWQVTDFYAFGFKDIKQKNEGGSFKGIAEVNYGELSFNSTNNQSLFALLFGMSPR